jgi:hypothetical protein
MIGSVVPDDDHSSGRCYSQCQKFLSFIPRVNYRILVGIGVRNCLKILEGAKKGATIRHPRRGRPMKVSQLY